MMEQQSTPGNKPESDEEGFPVDAKKWTREVAEILAKSEFKLSDSKQRGNETVEQQSISNNMPELDEDGFLIDTKKWTREVAEILARSELETGLTEDHWIVIAFMRRFYLEWGVCPPIRMIARRTGVPLRSLKELFPGGLTKTACRYAGIPRRAIRPSFMYPR